MNLYNFGLFLWSVPYKCNHSRVILHLKSTLGDNDMIYLVLFVIIIQDEACWDCQALRKIPELYIIENVFM